MDLSGLAGLQVDRIVELARKHLEMDVAYVAAFEGGQQVLKVVEGDTAIFGMSVGTATPLEDTYCSRMVAGDLPNVIPDVASNDRVRALPWTQQFGIGSYIGVPLTMPDGSVYGSLCCISCDAQPELTRRDVRFLELLAGLLVDELAAQRARDRSRERIQGLVDGGVVDIALQPIVSLDNGRCIGMEALSRFPAGFGTPDVVFAAAHEVGLGMELEQMAVTCAFSLLPTLRDPIYLGLNLAPAVAMNLVNAVPDLDDIPWHRLVLEITEHAAVADYAELRNALKPLRDKGMRVAVDDAGAGYASMQHVVEMRPDIIKVDRTLVDGLHHDPARRSVVSGFVLLAFELGATVLAEGVETADDLNAARRLGVRSAQGYVIARPSIEAADHRRWGAAHDLLASVAPRGH